MTSPNEISMSFGIANVDTHRGVPAIRNRRQPWIESSAKPLNDLGQRIAEVLVLAPAEAVPPHDDTAAKQAVLRIETSERLALLCREDAFEQRAPLRIELLRDSLPVESTYALDRLLCRDCVAYRWA